MKKAILLLLRFFMILLCCLSSLIAQEDSLNNTTPFLRTEVESILNLSVEKGLGKEIFSASKSRESIFKSPLFASVITRQEIQQAGITSIAEAMRLVPGAIVRETTPGNFDVNLRGLDNVPPYSDLVGTVGASFLVMVDGRPIYSHLSGGIFWETIPIDIQDIEQIEVVEGPATTLYGSNALNGVINIITRQAGTQALRLVANTQVGRANTLIASSSLTYQLPSRKFSMTLSGNLQERGRFDEKYYSVTRREYVPRDSLVFPAGVAVQDIYPQPDKAMDKYGVNIFLKFQPKQTWGMELSGGWQNSAAHKIYSRSPDGSLEYQYNESFYIHYQVKSKNLRGFTAYQAGTENHNVATPPADYQFIDALLEYDFDKISKLKITPSLFYRGVSYKDQGGSPYEGALMGGKTNFLHSAAAGIRLDYHPWEKIRVIAGLRAEKFNFPEDIYWSYQGIINYQPHENHLFRFLTGRANTESYFLNTFLNIERTFPLEGIPGIAAVTQFALGDKDLTLTTQRIFELGYRANISKKFSLDLTLYSSYTKNFTILLDDRIEVVPPFIQIYSHIEDSKTRARAYGLTLSVNYIETKWQLKPFVTFQKTKLFDFSPYTNSEIIDPLLNINTLFDIEDRATPAYYGGFMLNYQPQKVFNFNLNGYFFAQHTFLGNLRDEIDQFNTELEEESGAKVSGRFLLNTRFSYRPQPEWEVFISVRNLFSNTWQHYYSDFIRASYLFGFNFEL
ncbi:MAG: TonB-dependent receptor plug domain-containing protein [Microscillaceae bacterium]|nr:TonB-dependent receptor plug domain-containing protein [Microscillaceae bacterium]